MAMDASVAVLASLVEMPVAVCTVALARCGGSVDAAISFLYSQEGLALIARGGATGGATTGVPASSSGSASSSASGCASASAVPSSPRSFVARKRTRLSQGPASSSGPHAAEQGSVNSEPARIPESPPLVLDADSASSSSQKRKLTNPVASEPPAASEVQAAGSMTTERWIRIFEVEGPRSRAGTWHQWCADGPKLRCENPPVFSSAIDGFLPQIALVAFHQDVFDVMKTMTSQGTWVRRLQEVFRVDKNAKCAIGISAARHLFQAGEQLVPAGRLPDGPRDWTSVASTQAVLESIPQHESGYTCTLGKKALAGVEAERPTQWCEIANQRFSMWVSPENELYKTLVGWSSLGPLPSSIQFEWKVVPMLCDRGFTRKVVPNVGSSGEHVLERNRRELTPAYVPLSVITALCPQSFPCEGPHAPMSIPSNSSDEIHSQPPGFSKHSLRLEQQQLLQWMVSRESSDEVLVVPTVEASVGAGTVDFHCHLRALMGRCNHSQLSNLDEFQLLHDIGASWGYRFRLEAEFLVRGGILGDAMGFGKTATAIALTNVRRSAPLPALPKKDIGCFVESRATLILVPSNLVFQWEEEVNKFLGHENTKIIVIRHVTDLRSTTFGKVASADIVVCTCRLLASACYTRQRGDFANMHGNGCLRRATKKVLSEDWQNHVLLIESIFWARIIIDEFHEVEMMERSQRESLARMRSHYRWGLTGTPTVEHPKDVLRMAGFLGVSWLQQDCPIIAQRFLNLFIRQNAAPKIVRETIQVRQHVVEVRHTAAERALYLQRVVDRSQRHEEALMLCSHFNPEDESDSGDADAKETCCRLRKSKADRAAALTALAHPLLARLELFLGEARQVQKLLLGTGRDSATRQLTDCITKAEQQVASAVRRIETAGTKDVETVIHTLQPELRKLDWVNLHKVSRDAVGANEFTTEERQATVHEAMQILARRRMHAYDDGLAMRALNAQREILAGPKGFLGELQSAVKSNLFLQAQLRLLDNEGMLQQCAFCLDEDVPISALAITPCAHVFHHDCLKEAIRSNSLCPMCRTQVLPNQIYSVCDEIKAETAASSSDSAKDEIKAAAAKFGKYGTKLAKIAETLGRLCEEDATNRIILFCQWRALEQKIASALREFAVPFVRLSGSAVARGRTLSLFQGERSAERVLLMSLENSASGSNITAANHVVFVHPMWADTQDRAVAFEMQAIGRIWRHGQRRNEVHVWRFVTRGTIEEEITAKHQGELWTRHLSRQGAPQS